MGTQTHPGPPGKLQDWVDYGDNEGEDDDEGGDEYRGDDDKRDEKKEVGKAESCKQVVEHRGHWPGTSFH